GGARAGILTSALQMAVVLASLAVIAFASAFHWSFSELWQNAVDGLRIQFTDVRVDPTVRHSVLSLIVGGCGTILSLYATNQETIQRYMALPTLRKAQLAVMLNAPLNTCTLVLYTLIGVMIYGVFHGCHPHLQAKDKIFPYFVESKMNWLPGLEGIFMAAVYSAGVSTLTASYNALTAIFLEDIVKPAMARFNKKAVLSDERAQLLVRVLPFGFSLVATGLAFGVERLDATILQVSLSIIGSAGGTVFGVFCIGLFCPWIRAPAAALAGQVAALCVCAFIVIGTMVYKVTPVDLPLGTTCNATSAPFLWSPEYGKVTTTGE
ncbi:Sodium:solute symporter family protein, partial [Aphelenchoides avenae]